MVNKLIIAFPHESQDHVYVGNIISNKMEEISQIATHNSKISCLSINKDGTIIATTSAKGTIIRIFTTFGGIKFTEFRRGTKYVTMNCITFAKIINLLVVPIMVKFYIYFLLLE